MTRSAVSRETRVKLDLFVREFLRWNATHNLVAGSQTDELLERHIADSLQLATKAPFRDHWVDIGTGGGFPGLILAILATDPAFRHEGEPPRITCIESNAKKSAFLRAVAVATRSNVSILNERAENVIARLDRPRVVTARAVTSLDALLALCQPWLSQGTTGLFPKGRTAMDEVAAAERDWAFEYDGLPSQTSQDATIIRIRSLRPKTADMIGS